MLEKLRVAKKMVTTQEAAVMYSMSPGTLCNWRTLKRGPRYFTHGRTVRYSIQDLEDFFLANPVLTRDSLPEGMMQ